MPQSRFAVSSYTPPRIRIGISSCLLGNKVRYDGNHKLDTYITRTLGRYFEFIPVCPEMAIGLGVPRPPIRLAGNSKAPRAVGVKDPTLDVTGELAAYGTRMARELIDISGYILKSRSPSCGMERVKLYNPGRPAAKRGRGIYTAAFMSVQPLLPMEEEGRLSDPRLRENFIERVFAYHRWRELLQSGLTPAKLVAFHTNHKLAVMARGGEHYRALGRLVARAGRGQLQKTAQSYIEGFMTALGQSATPRRHANVLMHLMGYLKKRLSHADKQELLGLIEDYRLGRLPLIVPIMLLKHYFRLYPDDYVERQTYLNPHPQELMLRNTL
jgi:uncharacterized protein YbgA (DUF1722 family)/uncharacterized protein YbbK (DUF523 family)